jgi:hypothetical protein
MNQLSIRKNNWKTVDNHLHHMGELTLEYLNSMEYLQACIQEIIRIHNCTGDRYVKVQINVLFIQ